MTYRSYFANQNSTLGSVVPLAMFFLQKKCCILVELDKKIPLELLVCSIGRCGAAPLGHKDISAKIYIMKLPATAQQKISKKSNKTKI